MKVLKIGRAPDNDIVIGDRQVSNHHLLISKNEAGVFYVQDLNSSNGTFVNGHKINIEPTPLDFSDIIKIGETILPWRDYFKKEEAKADPEPEKPMLPLSDSAKEEISFMANNRTLTWGFVTILAIFLILLMIWYFSNVVSP